MSFLRNLIFGKPNQPQQQQQQRVVVTGAGAGNVTVHTGQGSATTATVVSTPVEHIGACSTVPPSGRPVALTQYRGRVGWNPFALKCAECPAGTTFHHSIVGANQCRTGGGKRKNVTYRIGKDGRRRYYRVMDRKLVRISRAQYLAVAE